MFFKKDSLTFSDRHWNIYGWNDMSEISFKKIKEFAFRGPSIHPQHLQNKEPRGLEKVWLKPCVAMSNWLLNLYDGYMRIHCISLLLCMFAFFIIII